MQLKDAMNNRDTMVIATIQSAFLKAAEKLPLADEQKRDVLKTLAQAYDEGVKEWEQDYLPTAAGPQEAKRILNHLTNG